MSRWRWCVGCAVLAVVMSTGGVLAQERERAVGGFGIGLIVGEPTGLSVRVGARWQGHAAWSFGGGEDALQLNVDYLFLRARLAQSLDGYLGFGVRGKFLDDFLFGFRIPAGVSHRLEGPIELFGEVVPTMDLGRNTELTPGAGLGIRLQIGGGRGTRRRVSH